MIGREMSTHACSTRRGG